MKHILIIGDGMADNPVDALNGKTPLQAAHKPFWDHLAGKSLLGHVLTVPETLPPGSDVAIMSIFGADPLQYFSGRSPLEAAGCGISVDPGCVSFRCNLITLEDGTQPFADKKILSHNAGSIDGQTSMEIIGQLCADPEFHAAMQRLHLSIFPTASYRHMVIQRNGNLDGMVTKPPHDIPGQKIGPYAISGNDNAKELRELMELANQKLDHLPANEARRAAGKMPANGIWFWAQGTAVQMPDFVEKYGHKGSVISAVPLVHGIGTLSGLRRITVEGATGEVDTNFAGKVHAAQAALAQGDDFVCIHLEAPDESTHNGSLPDKLLSIERIDAEILHPLVLWLKEQQMEHRILILSDHKSLMSTRTHHGDPVPFMIYDSRKDLGHGRSYTEENGLLGPYVEPGTRLMSMLFEQV